MNNPDLNIDHNNSEYHCCRNPAAHSESYSSRLLTELRQDPGECVCVLMVTNPKRGALLFHVRRISITRRLHIYLCVCMWHSVKIERGDMCERGSSFLYCTSSNVVWPIIFKQRSPLASDDLHCSSLVPPVGHYIDLVISWSLTLTITSRTLIFTLTQTHARTHATFTSLPPCPSPVSGQEWKDYRGKGAPLSLEIGHVLSAALKGARMEQYAERVCPCQSCNYIKVHVVLAKNRSQTQSAS